MIRDVGPTAAIPAPAPFSDRLRTITGDASALLERLRKTAPQSLAECDGYLQQLDGWRSELAAEMARPRGYRDAAIDAPQVAQVSDAVGTLFAFVNKRRDVLDSHAMEIGRLGESRAGRALRADIVSAMALAGPAAMAAGAVTSQMFGQSPIIGAVAGTVVSCWMAIAGLRSRLSDARAVRDLGYSASWSIHAADQSLRSATQFLTR